MVHNIFNRIKMHTICSAKEVMNKDLHTDQPASHNRHPNFTLDALQNQPATNHAFELSNNHHAHHNHTFEPSSRSSSRKVSTVSSHIEETPVRKKSLIRKSNSERTLNSSYQESTTGAKTEGSSWWYGVCTKFNSSEDIKKEYQPEMWKRVCPHPYCLSYRKVTRIAALTLIGFLAWTVLYAIVGDIAAPPKGQVYQLIILSIFSYFGGWLFGLTTLPALVGMLFTGTAMQNLNIVNIDASFSQLNKHLSAFALVIILTRAGLDLDPKAVNRLKFNVLKLSIIPWITEAAIIVILSRYLLNIDWKYAILLGSIIAAVAPAVVVPCLFRLRSKGYGVVKGIPTLIIAVASIDDALSVAVFGIVLGIIFNGSGIIKGIIFGTLSILAGMLIGVIWGVICNLTPERNDPFAAPLRILLLLAGGLAGVFGSELIGYGGAGPLICVTAAFVSLAYWSKQDWHIEDNPAAIAFEIFWMIFQPILFGITGSRIKLREMDGELVLMCMGILLIAVLLRIGVTILVGIGCDMNLKEKLFVSVSWISKGIVQAALGPVALSLLEPKKSDDKSDAEKIMQCCILSIILTAPAGALLTTVLGPILLTKEKQHSSELRIRKKSRRQSFLNPDLLIDKDIDKDREPGHNVTIASIVEEDGESPKFKE